MNDDELDPLHELASAYLDGDLGSAARAQVEASPELVGLVESFQRIRAELADVPPPSSDVRDAVLAAALSEFDSLSLPGGSTPVDQQPVAAPVVSLAERRRWPKVVLSVAAAALLVGGVGIAALNNRGSDSKTSSAINTESQQMSPADSEAASSNVADGKAPASTIGSINGAGASVSLQINTPEELLALQAPADLAFDSIPAPLTSTTTAPETTAPAQAVTAAPSGGAPDAAETRLAASNYSSSPAIACLTAQQIFLADIQYQGVFGIAARDTVTGVTQAIADDCTVLVSVGP